MTLKLSQSPKNAQLHGAGRQAGRGSYFRVGHAAEPGHQQNVAVEFVQPIQRLAQGQLVFRICLYLGFFQ